MAVNAQSQPPTPAKLESSQKPKHDSYNRKQKTNNQQIDTEKAPFMVKIIPTEPTQEEAANNAKEHEDKASSDRLALIFNGLLAVTTILIMGFNALLWRSTHKLWVATNDMSKAALGQAEDMKASIAESARAASAMEKVAESISANTVITKEIFARQKLVGEMQLRAYLSVVIGTGTYQERGKNLYFEVKPTVINNGCTPAHKVTYSAKAGILPFPLPTNFILQEPKDGIGSAAVLGTQHIFIINAIAKNPDITDGFYIETDVDVIKSGMYGRRLYIWGTVSYEDVFGNPRKTNFCHSIYWVPINNGGVITEAISGSYANQHNEAD